jgi:hypothetical protein
MLPVSHVTLQSKLPKLAIFESSTMQSFGCTPTSRNAVLLTASDSVQKRQFQPFSKLLRQHDDSGQAPCARRLVTCEWHSLVCQSAKCRSVSVGVGPGRSAVVGH